MAPQLERIAKDLRLQTGSRLKAELHNLLVYAPGQFFAPHQDSDKVDELIGTLTVTYRATVHACIGKDRHPIQA